MQFTTFLMALPSIASILAVLFFSIARGRVDRTEVKLWYDREATRLVRAEEWDDAWTAYRRIEQLSQQLTGATDPVVLKRMAAVAEQQERPEQVDLLMRRLLQIGERGDLEAHRYFAARFLALEPASEEDALVRLDRLELHLQAVCDLDPYDIAARAHLAELRLANGDREGAIGHLRFVAEKEPAAGFPLGRLLAAAGLNDEAHAWFVKAEQAIAAKLERDRGNFELTMQLAGCRAADGRYDQALRTIETLPRSADLDRQKGLLFVAWSEDRRRAGDEPNRLRLLTGAIGFDPGCRPAIEALLSMTAKPDVRNELRPQLADLVARGGETGGIHFLLGTIAALDGDLGGSRVHLDLAVAAGFRSAAVLNNLAWSTAFGPDPDPERALALAEEAKRLAPDVPEVRGTLGRILGVLGRHAEAVIELERALAGSSDPAIIHRSLADSYAALGQEALAESHRKQAADREP
ncbi:MAG TPA: hypothetical protein PLI18_09355 [Pirellulaceae bacterium]|nr:hypothetical protein [Pirellulaceae bacterium]